MNFNHLKTDPSKSWATKLLVDHLIDMGLFRNCLNCGEWNEKTEICKKYNLRPPVTIIVTGCENHSDLIPF